MGLTETGDNLSQSPFQKAAGKRRGDFFTEESLWEKGEGCLMPHHPLGSGRRLYWLIGGTIVIPSSTEVTDLDQDRNLHFSEREYPCEGDLMSQGKLPACLRKKINWQIKSLPPPTSVVWTGCRGGGAQWIRPGHIHFSPIPSDHWLLPFWLFLYQQRKAGKWGGRPRPDWKRRVSGWVTHSQSSNILVLEKLWPVKKL